MSQDTVQGMRLHVALVHHPVHNRHRETVATAVTNIDIHDLARTGRTYGVASTWIVTPLEQQRSLVERIVSHWQQGEGQTYNPIRAEAFERVRISESIEATIEAITQADGAPPIVVGTGAQVREHALPYAECRRRLENESGTILLLFGTGWGLVEEVMTSCDHLLPCVEAVAERGGYNHLSVRAAVAIILDRLVGDRVDDPA